MPVTWSVEAKDVSVSGNSLPRFRRPRWEYRERAFPMHSHYAPPVTQEEVSAPVFVDATGRRRRQVRRVAYAVGAVCMTYTGLVGASVIGDPVRPAAFGPFAMPDDRPPVVRQTTPPRRPPAVEAPSGGGRIDADRQAVPLRRVVAAPAPRTTAPRAPRQSPRVESTPSPADPTVTPTPTEPTPTEPTPTEPTDPPEPTYPPEPTDPPESPEPTEPVLPIVGGILDLLRGHRTAPAG
jgi:hypothetical protein